MANVFGTGGFFDDYKWVAGPIIGISSLIINRILASRKRCVFVETASYRLKQEIKSEIPNIDILYKGLNAEPNLYIVEAGIVNTGNADLQVTNPQTKAFTILIPEFFEICEAVVVETSDKDIICTISKNKHELNLNWDLLKTKEYVKFKLLIKCSVEKEKVFQEKGMSPIFILRFNINSKNKIADLKTKVKTIHNKPRDFKFVIHLLTFMMILYLAIIYNMEKHRTYLVYDLGAPYYTKNILLKPIDSNKVEITDLHRNVLYTNASLSEVKKSTIAESVIKKENNNLYILVYLGFVFAALLISSLYSDIKDRRLFKKLQ